MKESEKEVTKEYLDECFLYDKSTGELIWKKRPRHHYSNNGTYQAFINNYAGKKAGRESKGRYPPTYRRVVLKTYSFMVHRIIWKMVYDEWPDQIDHINGDGLDNRLKNLRSVTHGENCKNKRMMSTNKTGINGVSLDKKSGKWDARIRHDGKNEYLGQHECFFEACCIRKSTENKYGYHPNHGRLRRSSVIR